MVAKDSVVSVVEKVVTKTVPLSHLAPKQHTHTSHHAVHSTHTHAHPHVPKVDPKVPTKQNVSDLKNALAAVLKKGASREEVVPKKAPSPVDVPKVLEGEMLSPKPNLPVAEIIPKAEVIVPVDRKVDANPKEVPEDVLRKVLNVD